MATTLPIEAITRDWQCQPRTLLIPAVINEYAEAMSGDAIFPPVIVFHEGDTYWLADGFHRVAAATRAGLDGVSCEVREGTIRDAMLYSVSANATHGLQRTNYDKRRVVETLLADPEWSGWSDGEIARRCVVDHKTVARIRESLGNSQVSTERTYTTKHGTVATMNTANIGKRPDTPPSPVISVQTEPISVEPPITIDPAPDLDDDDEEFVDYDRPPSTPKQCQAVVTALEALLLALQRPEEDGQEHVMLTEVIEYLTTDAGADADDQTWMLTELGYLYMNIMMGGNDARLEALAALRAKAA